MKAKLEVDGVVLKGAVVFKPEVEPGQCVGCVFDKIPSSVLCPKNKHNQLKCATYSDGPSGIYVFVPGESSE